MEAQRFLADMLPADIFRRMREERLLLASARCLACLAPQFEFPIPTGIWELKLEFSPVKQKRQLAAWSLSLMFSHWLFSRRLSGTCFPILLALLGTSQALQVPLRYDDIHVR